MDYLQVVKFFCQMGPETASYLVEWNILHEYLDIYLTSQSTNSILTSITVQKENEKFSQSNMILIVDIFTLMIRACGTEGQQDLGRSSIVALFPNPPFVMLPETIEKTLLDSSTYLKSLLKLQQYNDNVLFITQHICWGNLYNSRAIIANLVSSLC